MIILLITGQNIKQRKDNFAIDFYEVVVPL